MKIIYLHQYFNTPNMTGGTRSYEIARRLVEKGHKVTIVTSLTTETNKRGWFITNENGIEVHWLPVKYSNHMNSLQRSFAFIKFAFGSTLRSIKLKGDIVFATSTPLTIALPAVLTSKILKIQMVFEVRDLWPDIPIAIGALKNPILKIIAKKIEKIAYLNAESIIALSPGIKETIVSKGVPSYKIGVIPNACDNDEFSNYPEINFDNIFLRKLASNNLILTYAGTIGEINGVNYLIDLAVELEKIKSNIVIVIIGEGKEKEKIILRAKSLNLEGKNIFFENSINKKFMPYIFSVTTMCSSIFIDLPEMRSNSANKFFDALASGKPIMINYGGWMDDLVKKYGCGLSTWQYNISDAAELIHSKLNNIEWVRCAGRASKKMAIELFDRNILTDKLSSIIVNSYNKNGKSAQEIAPGIF